MTCGTSDANCRQGGFYPLWDTSHGPAAYLIGMSFPASIYYCEFSGTTTPNANDKMVPYACNVEAGDCTVDDVYILFGIEAQLLNQPLITKPGIRKGRFGDDAKQQNLSRR